MKRRVLVHCMKIENENLRKGEESVYVITVVWGYIFQEAEKDERKNSGQNIPTL